MKNTNPIERMKSGRLYVCNSEELFAKQTRCLDTIFDYNATRPTETARRAELLRKIFASVGENCYIEPPLHANWGVNTHLGANVYANFNLTLVDDADVYIGDSVLIGPNVVIATALHPVDAGLRRRVMQYNRPVRIGDNVWIASGAIICPGVSIGENSVVGAGSVVTRDVPANVVAMGNPCRVRRAITAADRDRFAEELAELGADGKAGE